MIALFGGTFDPIHLGHLSTAKALKAYLNCDEMRLVPCHIPALGKVPALDIDQRLQMLQLALNDFPELLIDNCEIRRQQTSYCADTLQSIRQKIGSDASLCWCMGTDSFQQLPKWHRWRELLNYAHLIVVERPEVDSTIEAPEASWLNELLNELLNECATKNIEDLHRQPQGFIHQCVLPPVAISSTQIRQKPEQYQHFLTNSVSNYVRNHQLYE